VANEPVEPGYDLSVRVTHDAVAVRRATVLERVSRFGLRGPVLTEDKARRLKTSASELVLETLDPDGGVLDTFAWPATAIVYDDRINPANGDFTGSPMELDEWNGRLRIPVPAAARYLFFSRTHVAAGPDRASERTRRALGAYDLKPDGGAPSWPWPLPWPFPPQPIPGPASPHRDELRNLRAKASLPPKISVAGRTTIIRDHATLIDSGRPSSNAFDIVILSEGFQEAELDDFWYRANLLAYGLVLTPPYVDFLDRINVHVVLTASAESGLTLRPESIVKDTYFHCEGYWRGKPSRTFIGTDALDLVHEAVERVIPMADADLIAVVVNFAAAAGGSADPQNRQFFIPFIGDADKFINTAAHESCHVVAQACEEYIGCSQYDSARISPNQVTQDDVDANAVWWKSLAAANELTSDGRFAAMHVYGDPLNADCQPVMSGGLAGALGVFWGCQDTDPADPAVCDPYCDQRSARFYRPMAECKMRRLRYRFCRVCAQTIGDAIRAIAP
jgi:hypothetical protein